ncbi:MAG TPA: small ribosomal subunit Rsm22 family protein [Acidothermaceae bacterium]|jgi:ribosomal protein RSM22 (predicted rRNA methylase)|nr:small ribosomal subunit Rsm22 family protein [Acidothermaceae bacterium]
MPSTLRACIDDVVATTTTVTRSVERLIETYRSGELPTTPILSSDDDVLAYAVYRMPATYAVIRAALERLHTAVPELQPRSLADFGAGTGAAAWAAMDVWPAVESVTLLEQSAAAIELGSRIMASSNTAVLRGAAWRSWRLPSMKSDAELDAVSADIAIAAYVLGELTEPQQAALLAALVRSAPAVVLVEPGTPAGYARIIRARDALIGSGFTIAAPCPHELACPMLERGDWCHFAERLERSRAHRIAKASELSYEDEKYSYVAATRVPAGRPAARVLRHPQLRKGLVSLELCTSSGEAEQVRIAKSKGELYKDARDVRWGDGWPPD